ncbi:hypothetical protein GA0061098_10123 [Bradyrhizobium shewense]|uniref:Uncharacterized protein n=1 Tax=Bradyrhizobium shewense TaxID=1761772 RepID=A0A1C3X3U9_9BRAD|nr:hypothetical protein [Bradyrhizobium shewense]SCB46816.1 hypothetical protein GA0061098_10123 [Bradyrhizobium shewense]
MKNNRNKLSQRASISNEVLAFEITNARVHFEMSSNWLFGLADQIAAFPDMSMEATSLLRKLRGRALKGKLDKADRKSVYDALRALQMYSRMVASEDEPLSCLDTVESVSAFEDHLEKLRSVVNRR